jgi:hypothetical protein
VSATVTELRPADQDTAERITEREAAEQEWKREAQARSDARTLIPGPLRAEIRARAILRGEGRPCSFVPARIAEQVAALAEAAANSELADRFQAWAPLAEYQPTPAMVALVDLLRPFASEPIGMLSNVAGAVAHLDASGYGDERRQARAAAAELKRESGREKKRAAAAARAAKPAKAPRAAAKPKPTPQPEPIEEEPVNVEAVRADIATAAAAIPEPSAAPHVVTMPEPVEAAPPAATIPQPLADYLARLVNGSKLTYAAALVAHLFTGAERPEMPSADWAPKVLAKVEKYSGRKVTR